MIDRTAHYAQIKEIVRRWDRRELAITIIKQIRLLEARKDKRTPEPPFLWNLLFLLKMAASFGAFAPDEVIKTQVIDILHNECNALANFVPPEITEGVSQDVISSRIMRGIAHQQFWTQGGLNSIEIARSVLIGLEYTNLGGPQVVQESLTNFHRHALILYIWQFSHPLNLTLPPKDPSVVVKDKEEFRAFLSSMTLDISNYHSKMGSSFSIESPRLQIFEPSVFYQFPIWQINGYLYVVSQSILRRTISYFTFDRLSHFSHASRDHLAKSFERYAARLVQAVFPSAETESDLRKRLQILNHESCIDLFLDDSETPILIEFKALTSRGLVRVLPTTKHSLRAYKDTVIKGVIQGLTFSKHFVPSSKEPFLIVVTLEELYLPNTATLLRDFLAEGIRSRNPDVESAIKPENIFVISIENLEYVVALAAEQKTTISRLLAALRSGKEEYTLFSYLLNDHLRPNFRIPILSDAADQIFEEIIVEAKDILGE